MTKRLGWVGGIIEGWEASQGVDDDEQKRKSKKLLMTIENGFKRFYLEICSFFQMQSLYFFFSL